MVLCDTQAFTKSLIMDDLSCAQKLDGFTDIRIIDQPQDVVIGRAGFLLCCTFVSANFCRKRVLFDFLHRVIYTEIKSRSVYDSAKQAAN